MEVWRTNLSPYCTKSKRYFGRGEVHSRVRDEEIDWCVYRVIADGDATILAEVISCLRCDPTVIRASVSRLIRAGLIAREGDCLSIRGFQDTLLHQQMQDDDCPVYLDGGVIKVKNDQERPV